MNNLYKLIDIILIISILMLTTIPEALSDNLSPNTIVSKCDLHYDKLIGFEIIERNLLKSIKSNNIKRNNFYWIVLRPDYSMSIGKIDAKLYGAGICDDNMLYEYTIDRKANLEYEYKYMGVIKYHNRHVMIHGPSVFGNLRYFIKKYHFKVIKLKDTKFDNKLCYVIQLSTINKYAHRVTQVFYIRKSTFNILMYKIYFYTFSGKHISIDKIYQNNISNLSFKYFNIHYIVNNMNQIAKKL